MVVVVLVVVVIMLSVVAVVWRLDEGLEYVDCELAVVMFIVVVPASNRRCTESFPPYCSTSYLLFSYLEKIFSRNPNYPRKHHLLRK